MATQSMTRPVASQRRATPVRERWSEVRAQFGRVELGFDWLRVYLGIGLVVRGGMFASEPALLEHFIDNTGWLLPMTLAHGLVLAHIVGGMMLAIGCCTRWAAAVQIPFVAGALFLVHWDEGLLAQTQSLEFSALVLVMLVLYTICGAADFSIDHYLRRVPDEVATAEPALSMQRSLSTPPPAAAPHIRDAASHASADFPRANIREDLAGTGLDVPPEPAYARKSYREVKHELAILIVSTGVLFVLLLQGAYVAAAAWLIAALVMFTIWIIGHAQLD
jgi:uncharacterized membrane protein YphA (DoxX/SURF4 family)